MRAAEPQRTHFPSDFSSNCNSIPGPEIRHGERPLGSMTTFPPAPVRTPRRWLCTATSSLLSALNFAGTRRCTSATTSFPDLIVNRLAPVDFVEKALMGAVLCASIPNANAETTIAAVKIRFLVIIDCPFSIGYCDCDDVIISDAARKARSRPSAIGYSSPPLSVTSVTSCSNFQCLLRCLHSLLFRFNSPFCTQHFPLCI